ncbi:MAG: hypothetical protein HBSAPP03_03540 [Phycisphaerae bacterium]|nr:MAG: hypothetical protein HBSAPP03_03540 [Phycisphaerae bacterium]
MTTALHSPTAPDVASARDIYARLALPYIPRLLQLIDRNPFSRTYGCFDRAYWHYRTMDFPCGMAQEFVLPLALVVTRAYPGNPYLGVARVRELAEAAVRFLVPASHSDGTTDDYFPFERAMGALVFSLYAGAESYRLLGMNDPRVVDLLAKRVAHLAHENETGQLSNHQAFAALAAYTVFQITGDDRHRRVAEDRVALTLSWQHAEGWFQEYEGADPGYHTCTIDFLAKYMQKAGATSLRAPLVKAADFAANFMHPDGSYGGEYGSRNTFHFYPHGFELLAPHAPSAMFIAESFLRGAPRGKRYINDDDRMTAHYVYNFLQAYDDFAPRGPAPARPDRAQTILWLPGAKMALRRADPDSPAEYHAVANLAKGGALKVFDADGPIASDTGLTATLADGRTVVSHLVQNSAPIDADPAAGRFTVRAVLCRRRHNLPTPFKNIVFRALLLTVGRFNANLTRSMLQKILITGKPTTPFRFERTVEFMPDRVIVIDRIDASAPITRLAVGADGTSIYVANSNVYQESVLCPWQFADWNALPVEGAFKVWRREYFRGSGHAPGGGLGA